MTRRRSDDESSFFRGEYPDDYVPNAKWGLDDVVIPDYQRPPSPPWQKKRIAEGFSRNVFGTVVLAKVPEKEGGGIEVLDGQRRILLARYFGINSGPARVLPEMSYSERAATFRMIDHRKSLTTWDKYNADREAGDRTVLAIDKILAKHTRLIVGKDTPLYAGASSGFACIRAIDALLRSYYTKPTGDALDAALDFLCWWMPEGQQIHGGLLIGMSMMIGEQSSVKAGAGRTARTVFDIKHFNSDVFHKALKRTTYDLACVAVNRVRGQHGSKGGGHDEGFWKTVLTVLYFDGKLPSRWLAGSDLSVSLSGGVHHDVTTAQPNIDDDEDEAGQPVAA